MPKSYTRVDIERETRGMKIIDNSFSQELIRVFGEADAIRWFYYANIPVFGNQTPHTYLAKRGDVGKSIVAGEFYALRTGQPD